MPRANEGARNNDGADAPLKRIAPLSQKQEDLLIELFVQLSVSDRRKVIKLCRDLTKAAEKRDRAR